MIIEQHYDDEILIGLLESGDDAARDKHVSSCHTCAGALESLRAVTTGLQEATVWDERELPETPNRQIKNAIRGFAAAVSAEDREAESVVRQLLAADSDRSRALLQRNPEWRTAGVVRRILAAVDDVNFTDPKRAVDLTVLSTDIAESLDPAAYPVDTVMKLRATAWRERAYALCVVGAYVESLAALDRVEEHLAHCIISEFDAARASQVRAVVYGDLERLADAIVLARAAGAVYSRYGDRRRKAVTEIIEGVMLTRARRFSEALYLHLRLANDSTLDEMSRACATHNAAECYREMSHLDDAKVLFSRAVAAFERLGAVSMLAKARWHLARVLFTEHRFAEAMPLFTEVRSEFQELGMPDEMARVCLDIAETMLLLGRSSEVAQLCQPAIEYFSNAGLAYTAAAMTALAYLREAAEAGRLTTATVNEVRAFFEVLPKQPQLQFAHPS
jgi:tetratricopeptide (TPR) repeat protein